MCAAFAASIVTPRRTASDASLIVADSPAVHGKGRGDVVASVSFCHVRTGVYSLLTPADQTIDQTIVSINGIVHSQRSVSPLVIHWNARDLAPTLALRKSGQIATSHEAHRTSE
jgi:hypothetical protein